MKNDMIENLVKDVFENFEAEIKAPIWVEIQNAIGN
jgi:hypothetical protein